MRLGLRFYYSSPMDKKLHNMFLRLKFNQRPSTTLGAAINTFKKWEGEKPSFYFPIISIEGLLRLFWVMTFWLLGWHVCDTVPLSAVCWWFFLFNWNGLKTYCKCLMILEDITLGLWFLNSWLNTGKFLRAVLMKRVYTTQEYTQWMIIYFIVGSF